MFVTWKAAAFPSTTIEVKTTGVRVCESSLSVSTFEPPTFTWPKSSPAGETPSDGFTFATSGPHLQAETVRITAITESARMALLLAATLRKGN